MPEDPNLVAPNLTPKGSLGAWSEADFVKAIRTGTRPDGSIIDPEHMPWPGFAQMTDEELTAVYTYLKSLPPTDTGVP